MSWYPHAIRRPMPYNDRLPKRQQSPTVVLHTNAGGTDNGSLYGWFSRSGNDVCSHFQVMWDGTVEQYVDTDRQAYAQFSGNAFAVSVETQDDGKPNRPWSPQQVDAIAGICRWLSVPARLSPDGPGGGVGYHEQYADWNKSRHACPGKVREAQIRTDIIPNLGGDDMADVMVPLPDNYPYKDHKPGDLVPLSTYLEILGHQVFAIREVVQQDIVVDKQDAAKK